MDKHLILAMLEVGVVHFKNLICFVSVFNVLFDLFIKQNKDTKIKNNRDIVSSSKFFLYLSNKLELSKMQSF